MPSDRCVVGTLAEYCRKYGGNIVVAMSIAFLACANADRAHAYSPASTPTIGTKNPRLIRPHTISMPDYSGYLTGNWFGLRTAAQQRGINFGGSLLTDGTWSLSGGEQTRNPAIRTQLTLDASLKTRFLFGVPGGTFYASYMGLWGYNGSTAPVGSLQLYDSIINPRTSVLDELYYDQKFGAVAELRAGLQDASDFFAQPPDAQPFISDSPTEFPTLIDPPTFPDTAPGIVVVFDPHAPLTLKFGAYYFDRFHPSVLDQVLNTLEPTGEPVATVLMAEGDYNWQLPGRLHGVFAVGGNWLAGKLVTLQNSTQTGGGSIYSYIDQSLWTDAAKQSIGAFITAMAADRRVSTIDLASQGGLVGTGLVPGRPHDEVGLGYEWAHISALAGLPKPYELAIEAFYAFNFSRGISIQPDLQYYINTGGGAFPDAMAATVRISISF